MFQENLGARRLAQKLEGTLGDSQDHQYHSQDLPQLPDPKHPKYLGFALKDKWLIVKTICLCVQYSILSYRNTV